MATLSDIRQGKVITLTKAKEALSLFGMTIKRELGEYKVNFIGARNDTAYYTNDLQDALGTALYMCEQILKITAKNATRFE